jgi:probable phosphoglycerate mutase
MTQLYLVRHGETDWSKSGQHTSYTDLNLTENGVGEALKLREKLDPADFGLCCRARLRPPDGRAGRFTDAVDERLASGTTATTRAGLAGDPQHAARLAHLTHPMPKG